MQTYRTSILPVVAILLTILAMSYSACHESRADVKPSSGALELKQEISRFETAYRELKLIHENHIKDYSTEMGCNENSKALAIISYHNELLQFLNEKLEAHKLEFIQGDTANQERNKMQMEKLKKDFDVLEIDAHEIKTGLSDIPPTHATK